MTPLIRIVNGLGDLLLWPVRWSRPLALAWTGVLAGVALLWLFKRVTPQRRLAAARRRASGLLLELGLWQDDLRTMLRIQGELARANLRYLAASLPSLLVLLPLFVLIVLQLEARFDRRAPAPGTTLLVAAELADGADRGLLDRLVLRPDPGLAVDAGPVRDRADRTVWWRVRVTAQPAPGAGVTVAPAGAAAVTGGWHKRLSPPRPLGGLPAVRERAAWRALLLHPGEPPLPADAPVVRLLAELPRAGGTWLGVPDWLWWFALASVAGGLAVKGRLGVEI